MKSHKINQFFGRHAAFLLRWRWAAIALFAVILIAGEADWTLVIGFVILTASAEIIRASQTASLRKSRQHDCEFFKDTKKRRFGKRLYQFFVHPQGFEPWTH